VIAALGVVAVLVGCSKNDILQPDLPDILDDTQLATPAGAPAIYAGAVAELTYSHEGSSAGLAIYAALFTDEFMHASTPPAVREWDLRAVTTSNANGTGLLGPFLLLQRARTALEAAVTRVSPFFPANDKRIGELWALAGMTYILAGENFCDGAPFSERVPDLQFGTSVSTAEMFNTAVARLGTAAGASGGDAGINNLIAVLKGRALLNLGQYAEAAAAVTAVPSAFVYNFFHSATTARQNNNYFLQNDNDIYSVADHEGTNGLDFATAGDPRVPVRRSTRTATGNSRNDTVTPMYYFTKYISAADPVAVVTGLEARLIEAEAALQAGDIPGWLGFLNAARAQFNSTYVQPTGGAPPLVPLVDPGTADARVDLMFRERAFTMFLTGHRLGDLRRLVRQYGRGIESVYPTGAYHKQGLVRGVEATLPVPQTEENNPNYHPADCKFNQA
jgi:hypothetical protein